MANKQIITLLLTGDKTEKATSITMDIINNLKSNKIPTLIYEFNLQSYYEELKLNEDKLKEANMYLRQSLYVEDIIKDTVEHKELYDIQYLIIDGLDLIQTQENYCLDRSDIVSVIRKQLKELAQELEISFIATAKEDID